MENAEIARIFDEMADLMEIQGANPFRIRSFRNAVFAIADAPQHLATLDEGALMELPGIGKGIAQRIREILESGSCHDLRELRLEVPPTLLEVLKLSGVGPKKVALFWKELGVETLDGLDKAAREGKLRELPGMGAKSEQKILQAIEWHRSRTGRIPMGDALPVAESIVADLLRSSTCEQACYCGSLRRARDTVGDLDILVTSPEPDAVFDRFLAQAGPHDLLARGPTKASVRLGGGLQVDVRVVPRESYGAALHYFTGSKSHNVAIRDRAKRMGLRVNEYGVFREEEGTEPVRIGGDDEADVFRAVGLPFIPPELRENAGEIEAADAERLPDLVALEDIRGDLQMHTTWSDGKRSIREMALHAKEEMGYAYVAITDHSKAVAMTGGLDEEKLRSQWGEIDGLRNDPALAGFTILKSIECDILADGSLDLPDEVLREADWVLGCIHYQQHLPRAEQTERLARAIRSGLVDAVGHPTGRLLGSRNPMDLDMEVIFEACHEKGVALEVNANPRRLDLSDIHAKRAIEMGIRLVISTDAHAKDGMAHMHYGVKVARRAWATKADILNTRSTKGLRDWIEARRGAAWQS